MVLTSSIRKMPSIEEMFHDCAVLKNALLSAGFTSVLQISLMPREALMEIEGIKPSSASLISRRLREKKIDHRLVSEKLHEFINEHFPCVEDAPIGVLQVVIRPERSVDKPINRPVFAPLELITLIEKLDPDITIVEVMLKSREGLRAWIESAMKEDERIQLHDLDENLRLLSARLGYYDLGFATPSEAILIDEDAEIPFQPYRLHSVS